MSKLKNIDGKPLRTIEDMNVSPKKQRGRPKGSKKIASAVLVQESETSKVYAEPKAAEIDIPQAQEVIFKANPGPQEDFLASNEQEVLFGGAAGGGKSYAMIADPVRFFNNPLGKGLLVRRSTEELRELVQVSKALYPKAVPGIRFSERDKTWFAPSGASLWLSYLDREDDLTRYQGQAWNWIGFDELTQWPNSAAWNYMRSRLRSADPALSENLHMRATTNPGGVGHHWVKKTFIDPAPANTTFDALGEDGDVMRFPAGHSKRPNEVLFQRRFIPANLFDNPYLAEDGAYEANLLSLPEAQRRRLLDGDWSVSEGAAFTEFDPKIHVVAPFDIPHSWPKFRACDYGYGSMTAVLWIAVAPSDQLVVYRELYINKTTASDLAPIVLDLEKDETIRYGVLDSSLWHNRGDTGPSLAEQMIMRGCRWRPSDRSKGSRIAGKNELHRRLQVDEFTGEPNLVFFNTCRSIISDIPALPLDKRNVEDVDTTSAIDHGYDALRYGLMTRPKSSLFDFDPNDTSNHYNAADTTFGY